MQCVGGFGATEVAPFQDNNFQHPVKLCPSDVAFICLHPDDIADFYCFPAALRRLPDIR